MRTKPGTEVTNEQLLQLSRSLGDAVRKSGLGRDDVRRVLGRGVVLRMGISALLWKLGRSEENPFKPEKDVKEVHHYPKGWSVPVYELQRLRLIEIFPGIDKGIWRPTGAAAGTNLPHGADGWGLIPKYAYLGELWGIEDPYGDGYWQIIEKVLELISNTRPLHCDQSGMLNKNNIRLNAEARWLLEQRERETPGHVLVLPINFGSLYAGLSPRYARWEALHTTQLPLGSAQLGCLLLVMPERFVAAYDLPVGCSGDDYTRAYPHQAEPCQPFFTFNMDDGLVFDCAVSSRLGWSWLGSAVAFLGV